MISFLPATFMTAVSITYILMAKEGFQLNKTVSYIVGASVAALLLFAYFAILIRMNLSVKSKDEKDSSGVTV